MDHESGSAPAMNVPEKLEIVELSRSDSESAVTVGYLGSSEQAQPSTSTNCRPVPSIVQFCFKSLEHYEQKGMQKRKAVCTMCDKIIKESATTTTNFVRHVRTHHPQRYASKLCQFTEYQKRDTPAKSNQSTLDAFVKSDKFHPTHPTQRAIAQAIVDNLIVDCSMPMAIVEHPSFAAFMAIVQPKFNPISRTPVLRLLEERSKEIRSGLKIMLEAVNHISITLDIWSDRTMRGFIAITAHFVKSSAHSCLLTCERMTGKHTGDNIHETARKCLTGFGVESKVRFVVTDNASNMRKAFSVQLTGSEPDSVELDDSDLWEDLSDEQQEELGVFTDGKTRISCFAHTLQLCIGDGLKVNKSIYGAQAKASKITSLLHTSTTFKDVFERSFPNRSLKQPNNTRWNSTLEHVKSVVVCGHEKLNDILTEAGQDSLAFTNTQWAQLLELIELLDPFSEATTICQSDKCSTAGVVIPSVLALHAHLTELKLMYLLPVRRQLLESMERRFAGVTSLACGIIPASDEGFGHRLYRVAAFLDPVYFGWMEQYIDVDGIRPDMLQSLKDEVISEVKTFITVSKPTALNSVELVNAEEPPPAKKGLFSKLKTKPCTPTLTASLTFAEEIAKYESTAPSFDGSCLEYWNKYMLTLPQLYSATRIIFSAPASSAPVERVFSHSGIFIRPHRARLSAKNLANLVFCKCNRIFAAGGN